jgi:hypothetical protein
MVDMFGAKGCVIGMLIFAVSAGIAEPGEVGVVELRPEKVCSLRQSLGGFPWNQLRVIDMQSTEDATWFLVTSRSDTRRSAIIRVGAGGRIGRVIDLNEAIAAAALAVTNRGVAAVIRERSRTSLVEYDSNGNLISRVPVSCFVGSLLSAEGRPALVCPDGMISVFKKNGEQPVRLASWVRPGSRAQFLTQRSVVIIDETTTQAVVNDLNRNTVSVLALSAPELQAALAYVDRQTRAWQQTAKPTDPPLGRPVVVLDTAVAPSGLYLLVGLYHTDVGPTVVKFDSTGALVGRFRCRMPPPGGFNIHNLNVQNGNLLLSSTAGDLFRYAEP